MDQGVIFLYPKCTITCLRASKPTNFPGMIPLSLLKRGWEWGKRREGIESEDREGERGGRERVSMDPTKFEMKLTSMMFDKFNTRH